MTQTSGKCLLVAGATGLVGQAVIKFFSGLPEWQVVGLSRRVHPIGSARIESVDLADADACCRLIDELGDNITHFVYAAQYEAPGLAPGYFDPAAIALNAAMFHNLFDPLRQKCRLQHVVLLQGTKAYGVHHPELSSRVRDPLKESDPRLVHPNFYFIQQDALKNAQRYGDWNYTVFRPGIVCGDAAGGNMNCLRVIATYAALERARGAILDFPGGMYDQPFREAIDSDLLAEAILWAMTTPAARNRTFNITNGDVFRWRYEWETIARAFGMRSGAHRPQTLSTSLPARAGEWALLVDAHGLSAARDIEAHLTYNALVFTDWMLGGIAADVLSISTIAIRRAGFTGCADTTDMLTRWMKRFQEAGLAPRAA